MLFYSVAGVDIASEIPLPGRNPLDRTAEAAVTIRLDRFPAHISSPTKTGSNWVLNEAELLLSVPALASFLLVEGKEIRVQPVAGRAPEDAAPFLTQNVLGLLMQQRGRFVVRASAVAVGGRALLFCGDAAMGKSTIATAMAARGHPVLADDFCTIDWASDRPTVVHGDGVQPMLWADSIETLGLGNPHRTAVRVGCHKYHIERVACASGGVPLSGIYFFGMDRRIETPRIDTLRGMKAPQAIRESTYRPLALTAAQKLRYFEMATGIVRQEPIFSLTRTTGFGWLEEGLQAVEANESIRAERMRP